MSDDDVKKRLRQAFLGEFNEAVEVARRSGLPGESDGPQDAFRHIIGAALLTERFGAISVRFATFLYEIKPRFTGEGFKKERFFMDVHNNYLGMNLWLIHRNRERVRSAALEIIQRGRFEDSTSERRIAVGVHGQAEMRASWFDRNEWRDHARDVSERDVEQRTLKPDVPAPTEAARPRAPEPDNNSDDKKKPPVIVPDRSRIGPDEVDGGLPTNIEDLRLLLGTLEIGRENFDVLQGIDANLSQVELAEILREASGDGVLDSAIEMALWLSDTPGEVREKIDAWMKRRPSPGLTKRIIDERIEDPAQDFGRVRDRP